MKDSLVHTVIFAGGVGVRMGDNERPKQFINIYGKPIIVHTLERFNEHSEVDDIVVACLEPWIDHLKALVDKYKLTKVKSIVPGGATGQLSIYNGLIRLGDFIKSEKDIVLIHDGVRPLIDEDLICENIKSVREYGSAISASEVIETIMNVGEVGNVATVYNRSLLKSAKAPQSFYYKDIMNSHEKALKEGKTDFIDSCTMMAHYGYPLHYVDCPVDNIKVTTPKDYYVLKAYLNTRDMMENHFE